MRLVRLKHLLVISACLFWAACAQNGRSSNTGSAGGQAAGAPGQRAGNPPLQSQGTVDGGGGAGINGKPIESFQQKLMDKSVFPEFEDYILPVLKDVARIYPPPNSIDYFGSIAGHLIKNRSWYLVPIELKQIPNAKMGIPFSTDQWAYQTAGSIWISSLHYTGNAKDKATILLHEILVGIKILRHLSDHEQCLAMRGEEEPCARQDREPFHKEIKLTTQDYDQVRSVATWLLENHATMTGEQFAEIMHNNQFFSHKFDFYEQLEDKDRENRHRELYSRRKEDIDLVLEKDLDLYANYDDFTHIAGATCKVRLSFTDDHKALRTTVKLYDRKNSKLLQSRDDKFLVENFEKLDFYDNGPFNPKNPNGEFSLSLSTAKQALKKGMTYVNLLTEFSVDELIRITWDPMFSESNTDSGGFYAEGMQKQEIRCARSEIEIPWDYPNWRDLPKEDREILERRWFHDTVENLKRSAKFDIRTP
jgi:hypothetical protein